MLVFVRTFECSFVCLSDENLSRALNLHLKAVWKKSTQVFTDLLIASNLRLAEYRPPHNGQCSRDSFVLCVVCPPIRGQYSGHVICLHQTVLSRFTQGLHWEASQSGQVHCAADESGMCIKLRSARSGHGVVLHHFPSPVSVAWQLQVFSSLVVTLLLLVIRLSCMFPHQERYALCPHYLTTERVTLGPRAASSVADITPGTVASCGHMTWAPGRRLSPWMSTDRNISPGLQAAATPAHTSGEVTTATVTWEVPGAWKQLLW